VTHRITAQAEVTDSRRVAMVTGAGQGVGRGVALALADEGVCIVAVGRTPETLERTVTELRERGAEAIAAPCDVASRDQVDAAVRAAITEFGRLDILVNCAQTVKTGRVLAITPDDVRAVWESGFVGTLNCMQAAYPHLEAARGAVVNVGTAASLRPDPVDYGLYASVKEAIRTLSRTAAVEWGPVVRVNCIIPLALSPGLAKWIDERPEESAAFVATVPMGRVGDCEQDIGRVVAFLVGPTAGYVTGVTLTVDGGQAYLR
jgi:NAD(P)-dependent dehydrogenase (short-subunit alcohol dehydrogenase family)